MKQSEFKEETWKKLKKEFGNQKLLNHENVVKAFGWTKKMMKFEGKKDEFCYGIVMEYMELGDLEGKI